jgi:hypothetical protein
MKIGVRYSPVARMTVTVTCRDRAMLTIQGRGGFGLKLDDTSQGTADGNASQTCRITARQGQAAAMMQGKEKAGGKGEDNLWMGCKCV